MVYLSVLQVPYIHIDVDKYLSFSGVYFFTFSMMKHEDVEEVYVYLMHNGNTVFSMYRWVVFSITVLVRAVIACSKDGKCQGVCRNQQGLT